MTILQQAAQGLSNLVSSKAPNIQRPPQAMGGLSSGGSLFSGGGGQNRTSNLAAMAGTAWLFSVVDRISSAVAMIDWHLYRVSPNGERVKVLSHPALSLWQSANPYYTGDEFLECTMQHFELVGESWWVLVRSLGGVPLEIWPVRADRMRPIPDRDAYISGYIYQLGAERIPLEAKDVIFIRRPSPTDPYRGMGVVQTLVNDLEGERMAAQWQRNFYSNSAEPGGIIEMNETLSDEAFARMAQRWREQHQGVANAHRVAIIEQGTWKDRKYTQRDMQLDQYRLRNRDTILGAFGVHKHILGASDDVNRANAEAANYQFAYWVLTPRLRRIRAALNSRLLPAFGPMARNLMFDFEDPVAENRELSLEEAVRGFEGKILTRNEARKRLGEGKVDDGDMFLSDTPIQLGVEPTRDQVERDIAFVMTKGDDPLALLPSPVAVEQQAMEDAWGKRLEHEAKAIAEYIEPFMKSYFGIEVTKIEASDLDAYDWDWWGRHGDDVIDELTKAYTASITMEFPGIDPESATRLASQYAATRGAELLRVDGPDNLVKFTRQRVNELVAGTIERGEGLGTLQRNLRNDFGFGSERARMIARTETAFAHGHGSKQAALAQGRDEKLWVTQGDSLVNQPICATNAIQGWLKVDNAFQSGHDTIPGHVNCRCNVRYRTAEVHPSPEKSSTHSADLYRLFGGMSGSPTVTRCSECDRMLGKNLGSGAEIKCRCGNLHTVA